MRQKRLKEVGRCVARDAAGNEYQVVCFAILTKCEGLVGPAEWIETNRTFKTADGRQLNCTEPGRYAFPGRDDDPLISDDPAAP